MNQDLEKPCASSASINLDIFSWLPFAGAVKPVFAVPWALILAWFWWGKLQAGGARVKTKRSGWIRPSLPPVCCREGGITHTGTICRNRLHAPVAAAIRRIWHGGDAQLLSASTRAGWQGSASPQHGGTPAPNHPQGPRFSPRPLLSRWVLSLAAQPWHPRWAALALLRSCQRCPQLRVRSRSPLCPLSPLWRKDKVPGRGLQPFPSVPCLEAVEQIQILAPGFCSSVAPLTSTGACSYLH